MENWVERFKLNECFIIISILLAFLILAIFGQRKIWISTESIMMCISGLIFFVFPKQVLALGVKGDGQIDDVGIGLGRLFGLTLIGVGLIWFFVQETRDGTVVISVLQSRVFASLSLLVIQSFAYFGRKVNYSINGLENSKSVQFSEQMFFLGIFPTLIWFTGNLLHLARSSDFNSFPQHNISLNNHLKFEAMLSFSLGIMFLAFPSQILQYLFRNNGNKVSLHLVRSIGCLNVGSSMLAMQAPGYLHERDKRAIFLLRLLTCLLQLGYCFWLLQAQSRNLWSLVIFVPLMGNALIGYFWSGTNIYKPMSTITESGAAISKID